MFFGFFSMKWLWLVFSALLRRFWSLGRAAPFGATAAACIYGVYAAGVCRCGSTKSSLLRTKDQQRP